MNKEQQELLDEEYSLYLNESRIYNYPESFIVSKDEFINKCKTDPEFSEKWGLTIEERELSLEEREKIAITKYPQLNETPHGALIDSRPFSNEFGDSLNIPTKLITIKYNDATIESYE
jgi:hypothetical protein